jgi:hypothetical protein
MHNHFLMDCEAGKGTSVRQWWFSRFLGLFLAFLPFGCAFGDEALPICVLPSVSAGGMTLLLDAVERDPVALLLDPDTRLLEHDRPAVLQTVWENPEATGLPRLRLADPLPEFWVQPASWRPFVRGPEGYSGMGTEVRARDWAGIPATDRRAYRLDPGLRKAPTLSSVAPPGAGLLRLGGSTGAFRLTWNGVAGRVYQLYYTADLGRPFQLVDILIASEDGEAQFALPTLGSSGFYRVAEVTP